jgi:YHS domain-containing protein
LIDQEAVPPTAVDPVCGMTVNPATAAGHYEHQGKTYYFCAWAASKSSEPIQIVT